MVSMMNITLKHLEGMWLSEDTNSSMWIGGVDLKRVEICINRKPVISEHTHFEHDTKQNVCIISNSVFLWQLFDNEAILVRFQIEDGLYDLILNRRK